MKKTVENFMFQSIFQITKIIIPMITIPIVSRSLGANGIGVYNYTTSIVQYIVILSGLGINLYGNREIAQNRENLEKKSEIFFDLFLLKFMLTIFLLGIYFIFIGKSTYSSYFIAQSFTILAVSVDISWFFMGIEDFKKTSIVNLFFQIISLILIVIFINGKDKLLLYIYIQSLCMFFSQLGPWMFVKKELIFIKPKMSRIKEHFFSSLPYFVPQIAVLLYSNINKTILGVFSTKENVAYYANSQTINSIVISLITTMDTVLLPKMSNLSKNNQKSQMMNIMNKSIILQLSISIPTFFGIIAITPEFIPWFFGSEFEALIVFLPIMSCLIVVVPLGMSISRQYLLPMGEIKDYNNSVIYGAVVNILLNSLLIKSIGIYAAIISTISAELLVTTIRIYKFLKKEYFRFDFKQIFSILLTSIVMYLLIRITTNILGLLPSIRTTLIQVIIGLVIYLIVGFILKLNIINLLKNVIIDKEVSK